MKGLLKLVFWLAVLAALVYVIGWAFLFEAYTAEDNSLAPNLIRGDKYLAYVLADLSIGTPVVCNDPRDESSKVVGRIAGEAGDKVALGGAMLFLNGVQSDQTIEREYVLVDDRNTGAPQTVRFQERIETLGMIRYLIIVPLGSLRVRGSTYREVTVPEDTVFLIGDNRAFAEDSRTFGPVKTSSCIGRPLLVYRPAEVSGDAGSSSRWLSIIR